MIDSICWDRNHLWLRRMNLSDQKDCKKEVLFTTRGTARWSGRGGRAVDRPCPNLATEDTYGDGGEDDVRGRCEDDVGEVAAAKRFVADVVEG